MFFLKSYHYPYSSWGAGGDALTNVKCYKALDGPYISFKEAILPLVMSSFLHPNKSIKKIKYKRRGIKLKSLQNVCNFCTDALSIVSGDKMITLVSLNIVGTICLSPNLPKPICIHVLLPSCYAVSIWNTRVYSSNVDQKGPFSCHTGQETALCHVNSGINSISALISQRSGMAYSLTCQKETIYNVLHDFLLV